MCYCTGHYVKGKWVNDSSSQAQGIINPAIRRIQ